MLIGKVKKEFWLFLMFCSSVFGGGCLSTIKQKFTRQPKSGKNASIIKPIESDQGMSIRQAYERHFIFAKVWIDEINVALDTDSAKRVKEALDNAVENLEILQHYFASAFGKGNEDIARYIAELNDLVEKAIKAKRLKQPITLFRNKIENIRIDFHKKFLPSRQPEELWKAEI